MFPCSRIAIDQTPVCIAKPDVQWLNQRYCNTANEEGVPSEKNTQDSSPVSASHIIQIVMSFKPDTEYYPSGETATDITASACPKRRAPVSPGFYILSGPSGENRRYIHQASGMPSACRFFGSHTHIIPSTDGKIASDKAIKHARAAREEMFFRGQCETWAENTRGVLR